MDRKKVLYIALMVVLVALLLFGQWYKRPLGLDELVPDVDARSVSLTVTFYPAEGETNGAQQRTRTLTAEEDDWQTLWQQLSSLEFRRPPTNLVQQFLPASESKKEKAPKTQSYACLLTVSDGTDTEVLTLVCRDSWSYDTPGQRSPITCYVTDQTQCGAVLESLWDLAAPAA